MESLSEFDKLLMLCLMSVNYAVLIYIQYQYTNVMPDMPVLSVWDLLCKFKVIFSSEIGVQYANLCNSKVVKN